MALGFSLPVFAKGTASAQELNKITIAKEYIQNRGAFNYAWPEAVEDSVRYMLHRYRYLHWYVYAPTSAKLYLNGNQVATVVGSNTYGTVDLNPLNIPFNDVYQLKWDNGTVAGICLFEHPAQTFNVSYPYAVPVFTNGSTLTSFALNQVSANTQYLIDYYASGQGCGFTQVAEETLNEYGGPGGDLRQQWDYWVRHEHRYLYVATDRRCFGDPGATRRIKLLINGTAYYQDTDTYPTWWPHAVAVDLNGGADHHVYQGSGNPITAPTIAKGQWYKLSIFMQTESNNGEPDLDPLSSDECYIHVAGEMPARDWI